VAFSEVAPVAMMLGSTELLRAWVLNTLAGPATDDEHHSRPPPGMTMIPGRARTDRNRQPGP
jgi:hypothetical protein